MQDNPTHDYESYKFNYTLMPSTPSPSFSPHKIKKFLPTFYPASSGAEHHPELTLIGAERFPHAMHELCVFFHEMPTLTPIQSFNHSGAETAKILYDRFCYHKTDKGYHNYHIIYGEILSRLGTSNELNILEIGLGTNDTSMVSHMHPQFSPCAALRAFRDVAPNSQIYGADIDKGILYSEERIQTAWVDQMEPESFLAMNRQFGNIRYDLIIDDGLHAVSSNLNTLLFALTVLKEGGWIVIEDIWRGQICWDTIYHLIPSELYNRHVIKFDTANRVFAIEKRFC